MRAQGLFVTLALLAYTLGAGYYIAGQRERIMDNVVALERLAEHEKALALTEAAVSGALVDVSEASNAGLGEPASPNELRLYMETCASCLRDLEGHDPGYALLQRAIGRSYESLQAQPVRANWIDLRETMSRAATSSRSATSAGRAPRVADPDLPAPVRRRDGRVAAAGGAGHRWSSARWRPGSSPG
jgi:hypothetical protein